MTTTKPKAIVAKKPGRGHERMKAVLGPKKTEGLRQQVVADQEKARNSVQAAAPAANASAQTKKPPKEADARKITVLADKNPHASGSRRAGWFAKLKTGMTVEEAVKAGVRATYITRMATRKVVKLA